MEHRDQNHQLSDQRHQSPPTNGQTMAETNPAPPLLPLPAEAEKRWLTWEDIRAGLTMNF